MAESKIVLEARGITKQFPGVLASDNVNFYLRKGEIHALLGENGAGKSTLMNLIYGLHLPDKGEMESNHFLYRYVLCVLLSCIESYLL